MYKYFRRGSEVLDRRLPTHTQHTEHMTIVISAEAPHDDNINITFRLSI